MVLVLVAAALRQVSASSASNDNKLAEHCAESIAAGVLVRRGNALVAGFKVDQKPAKLFRVLESL